MTEKTDQTDLWGVIEIMGHNRFAGRISESTEFGVPLVRVDVPEIDGQPEFSKLFGGASIYCITPTDEATARAIAGQLRARPLSLVHLPSVEPARIDQSPPSWMDEDDYED